MNRQTLEPKPTREVIDQVFLSPRVLDKAAFEEFTSIIKQLIERASEATKALQTSAVQAEAIQKKLAESAPLIESRLTGAGAAIATLDARTAEVRAALNKAAECAVRAETAQVNAERIAADGAAQVETRLNAATHSGQNTLENVRAGVELRAREIAESALRAIEAAGARLEDLEAQSAARLTDVVEQAGRSMQQLEERLNHITGRIATLTGAGLGAMSSLCDRAAAILGYDPSSENPAAPLPGSLADLVASAERAEASCDVGPATNHWCEAPERLDPTEPLVGQFEDVEQAGPRRKRSKRKPASRRAGSSSARTKKSKRR
jgi:hypothetical protein